MSVSEAKRHDLYNGLNELLGAEQADTLMEYLPTDTNLVTQQDLLDVETRLGSLIDGVETGLGARMDRLGADLGELKAEFKASRSEFNQRLDKLFLALVTSLFAVTATLIAAVFIV